MQVGTCKIFLSSLRAFSALLYYKPGFLNLGSSYKPQKDYFFNIPLKNGTQG